MYSRGGWAGTTATGAGPRKPRLPVARRGLCAVPTGRLVLYAAELAALDEPSEVLEVLPHYPLGVRDGFRHDFPDLAAGRVGVVHRHFHARAIRQYLGLRANLYAGVYQGACSWGTDRSERAHSHGPNA